MSAEGNVRAAFARQAESCARLGAPFAGRVVGLAGAALDETTEVGRRCLGWEGEPDVAGDALPLRVAGGLHGLVREGALPALAALYPPNPAPPDDAPLAAAIRAALAHPGLLPWLESAPQTNEVSRSSALMAGLLVLARETGGMPFALRELGASAGLNLWPERYAHELGGLRAGDAASPVRLAVPEWHGPPPPGGEVRVASRRGVDLRPVDPADPAQRARILAYIWPDQPRRLARAEAALALAAREVVRVERGDAAGWMERELALQRGATTVVWHSIARQYFPAAAQTRVAARIAQLGAAATEDAPLAWLRLEVEPARHDPEPALLLTAWPGGEERLLATASPHLLWVRWRG